MRIINQERVHDDVDDDISTSKHWIYVGVML